MFKSFLVLLVVAAVGYVGAGCSNVKGVKSVIVKDLPIEEQNAMLEKYKGKHGWARNNIEDVTERVSAPNEPKKNVIPRDTKVTITDIGFAYEGTVILDDPKGKRLVAALKCKRPLTPEKIETRLGEILWFDDPVIRHVEYVRKWGKKTAQSVMNHEVFAGMPSEAARESWGYPDDVRVSEVAAGQEQQWVYKQGKRNKYIYIIGDVVGRWEE